MEVKEVNKMTTAILTELEQELELSPLEEMILTSDRVKRFVLLSKLIEHAAKEKERIKLDEMEKQEAFEVLQKEHNIPEYITVHDAADILEVSAQMVRRYCAEEKIKAFQRFPGSGKWLIETKQFMDNKNWGEFVQKRARIKEKSIKLATKMIQILDEN